MLGELVVILTTIIALIVFGPMRLVPCHTPYAARGKVEVIRDRHNRSVLLH